MEPGRLRVTPFVWEVVCYCRNVVLTKDDFPLVCVTGDMVLYESHSVIHGRPFPLKGRYYANIFIHFEVRSALHHFSRRFFPVGVNVSLNLLLHLSPLVTHSVTTAMKQMLEVMSTKSTGKL
jgi:hypothetical protein